MTSNVFQIRSTPKAALVETLENLLERARSGQTLAIAVVEVSTDKKVSGEWVGSSLGHYLNSGLAILSHRMATEDWD